MLRVNALVAHTRLSVSRRDDFRQLQSDLENGWRYMEVSRIVKRWNSGA